MSPGKYMGGLYGSPQRPSLWSRLKAWIRARLGK